MDQALSRGYLNEDFRMFHIRDRRDAKFDFHFHSFDKVVIFLSGRVTYYVEDKAYYLRPWDVLLVGHDQVHRPAIAPEEVYDRVIFYVNPAYLDRQAKLTGMFARAKEKRYNILRPDTRERLALSEMYASLEAEIVDPQFGADALKAALMTQIMITLNRISLRGGAADEHNFYADPKISEIVEHILSNLSGELAIEKLAERFFVSPSFLMHRFREVTGYSPHNYITIKRMACASELMAGGDERDRRRAHVRIHGLFVLLPRLPQAIRRLPHAAAAPHGRRGRADGLSTPIPPYGGIFFREISLPGETFRSPTPSKIGKYQKMDGGECNEDQKTVGAGSRAYAAYRHGGISGIREERHDAQDHGFCVPAQGRGHGIRQGCHRGERRDVYLPRRKYLQRGRHALAQGRL